MDITIKVLGEYDNVSTRIVATTAPKTVLLRQLRQAIGALESEMRDLEACPYHSAGPRVTTSDGGARAKNQRTPT